MHVANKYDKKIFYMATLTWIFFIVTSMIDFDSQISSLKENYKNATIESATKIKRRLEQKIIQYYFTLSLITHYSDFKDRVFTVDFNQQELNKAAEEIAAIVKITNINFRNISLQIVPKNLEGRFRVIEFNSLSSRILYSTKSDDLYSNLEEQMSWFNQNPPTSLVNLESKMLTAFSKSMNRTFIAETDSNKKKDTIINKEVIIFSAPIYRQNGLMQGSIALLIDTNEFQKDLFGEKIMLYNPDYELGFKSNELDLDKVSLSFLKAITYGHHFKERNDLFTYKTDLNFRDDMSKNWHLVALKSYADFFESKEYYSALEIMWLRIFLISVVIVAVFLYISSFQNKERESVKKIFKQLHGSHLLDVIEKSSKFAGQSKEVTVLFADIRGFSIFAEERPPEEVVEMLNEHFGSLVAIIQKHGGVIDKFIGDAVMATWGSVVNGNESDLDIGPQSAVLAALEIRNSLNAQNAARLEADKIPINIGMGIHFGKAVVGMIGSSDKLEFTTIGATVNSANKIEKTTKLFATDLLISEQVWARLDENFICQLVGSYETKSAAKGSFKIYKVIEHRNIEAKVVGLRS